MWNCDVRRAKKSTLRTHFLALRTSVYAEERKKFIKQRITVSQYESENIMFALLGEIISMPEWNHLGVMPQYPLRLLVKSDALLIEEEKTYKNRSWTLIDFVLYNKTTKMSVLAIEVDGMAFRKSVSTRQIVMQ